jgi:putative nucleotidyltransferase with HDIG domain
MQLRARIENSLHELPVLPHAVVQLMALDPEHEDFFDLLLETIQPEPTYTTRILALANSATYAGQAPTATLRGAISRVGSRGASNLVLALSVTRVFVPRDKGEKGLWRHALQVAFAARELARIAHDPEITPDEAYVGGLLHDIGRFVLFQEGPATLRQIDEGQWDDPEGLLAMEESICGFTHPDIGAIACDRWGLPDLIKDIVQHHHAPRPSRLEGKALKLTSVVRAADLAMFPSARPESSEFRDVDDETLRVRVQEHLPPFITSSIAELRTMLRSSTEEATTAADVIGLG